MPNPIAKPTCDTLFAPNLLHAYYSAAQSRALDRYAIETLGIPGVRLMKQAAFFAYQTLKRLYPECTRLYVLCGTGNNGGDGYGLAQYARLDGWTVKLAQLGSSPLKGDALTLQKEWLALGESVEPFSLHDLKQSDVVVDAVFGTGLNKAVAQPYADIFSHLNQSGKPVLALDLPSGLNADTGAAMGIAVQAQHTCTFITRKLGLVMHQGQTLAGQVHYSDLNIPSKAFQNTDCIAVSRPLSVWQKVLPHREATRHKGNSGRLVFIGGNHSMMGAIQMAAFAGLKSGAGLVKIITRNEHLTPLTLAHPEFMCYSDEQQETLLNSADAMALGPGLGSDDWADALCRQTLVSSLPKIVDADALKWLANHPMKRDDWILTPHPGEAARLLDTSTQAIQQDRVSAIQRLQQQYGGIVVLKGNGTLIYDGQHLEVCPEGNPGMAVGGMGDVLSGILTSLVGQGLSLFEAACLGVSLHATAGDRVAERIGEAALTPTDLIQALTECLMPTQSASPN